MVGNWVVFFVDPTSVGTAGNLMFIDLCEGHISSYIYIYNVDLNLLSHRFCFLSSQCQSTSKEKDSYQELCLLAFLYWPEATPTWSGAAIVNKL